MYQVLILVLVCLCVATACAAPASSWDVQSPDGKVRIVVRAAGNDGGLQYRVEHGSPEARATVIGDSPLGLKLTDADFTGGLRFDSADGPRPVNEPYVMPHGKRRECRHRANALTLRFRNRSGAPIELDLRAGDDGAAFRYRLPGSGDQKHTLAAEATGFAVPADARMWMHPYDKATTYSPAYETYFENGIAPDTASPTGMGWAFPVLFRTADEKHWALITEANVGPNYFGGRLTGTAEGGVFRIRLPDPAEGHGYGAVEPIATLPWEMPWRVIILGDSPGAAVESTLVTDLSAPAPAADTSWVRPGRVAWSWWSDQPSPRDGGKQKRFIDFAAEMGWEYVLVDANWTIIDNGTIHDVIRHAKSKNVGVLLWYNSGGPHNIVTEKPRDSLFFPEVRRFELKMLKEWGVKGIKVDFFQSDKPDIMALYHGILKDAAEAGIMINFHGCTLPRGWSRTYPHLMSMEAIRGEECYIFDDKYPDAAPVQNTITPFTRNAVGPMDYTPVGLANNNHPHKTSYAHELALTVLFESSWLHFADDPDVYRKLPEVPLQFLKEVPAAWDDTRFITGYPGREAVIARRHGQTWYVAGVNGRNQPAELTLNLQKALGSGDFTMTLIADGPSIQQLNTDARQVKGGEPLQVAMRPYGGFVARFVPAR